MKKNTKLILILVVIAIFILLFIFNIIKNKELERKNANTNTNTPIPELTSYAVEKDGVIRNVSDEFKKDKKYDEYELTKAEMIYSNGKTQFSANLKNVSNYLKKGHVVYIIFLNKDGNEIGKMGAYIKDLDVGVSTTINASIDEKLVNAFNYKFVKK